MKTEILTFRLIVRILRLSPKPLARKWFVIVMALSFLIPIHFCKSQIYVDPCAPFEGDGSQANPFKTLVSAVAMAKITSGNDNIIMKGGEYLETLTIDEAVTLTAQGGSAFVGKSGGLGWRDMSINVGDGLTTNARAYYPSYGNGKNAAIVSCGTGFPAIVYVHGKRDLGTADLSDWCDDDLRTDNSKDYLQAEGILKQLASNGVIAISFNWHSLTIHEDVIGSYVIDILDHIGAEFGNNIALDKVGLIGHSTGGAAVMYTAQSLYENGNPSKGIALIAPTFPLHPVKLNLNYALDVYPELNLYGPVLIIHGTNEHACQVGTSPLKVYCITKAPKHLVVIPAANHFGYTDGISLDPDQPREGQCFYYNPYEFLLNSDGHDNPSEVGGLIGQKAQTLQQRTVNNYLGAFFSHYLHGNTTALAYLQQQGDNCSGSDQELQCGVFKSDVYMWWPTVTSRGLCPGTGIYIGDGFSQYSLTIDQRTKGGQWNYLGQYEFREFAAVNIRSPSGCSVIADAVKFVLPDTAEEFIIDNNSQYGADSLGTWQVSSEGDAWDGDYLISNDSNARFTFSINYPWKFYNSGCEPIRYFDDLESLNVKVNVCSCIR